MACPLRTGAIDEEIGDDLEEIPPILRASSPPASWLERVFLLSELFAGSACKWPLTHGGKKTSYREANLLRTLIHSIFLPSCD
jgi:hypothetical protein